MFHAHPQLPDLGFWFVHNHDRHHDHRLDHVVATKPGDRHDHGFVEQGHFRIGPARAFKSTGKGK